MKSNYWVHFLVIIQSLLFLYNLCHLPFFLLLGDDTLKFSPAFGYHELPRKLTPCIFHAQIVIDGGELHRHALPAGLLDHLGLDDVIRHETFVHLDAITVIIAHILFEDDSTEIRISIQGCLPDRQNLHPAESIFDFVDAPIYLTAKCWEKHGARHILLYVAIVIIKYFFIVEVLVRNDMDLVTLIWCIPFDAGVYASKVYIRVFVRRLEVNQTTEFETWEYLFQVCVFILGHDKNNYEKL